MDKEYSPWYWHNKALREHPEYQMEGILDCLREEMMMNMPVYQEEREAPRRDHIHYHFHMPTNASKRKSTDTNKLNNIYKGTESGSGKP